MPAAKKSVVRSNTKSKNKQSWLSRTLSGTYAKPAMVVLAFMVIGGGSAFWAMAATMTSSLWSTSTVPKTIDSGENSSIELGVRFKSDVAGYVTGVRFYKSALNTGTHTGSLWDSTGKALATVTFSNETASGWQTANFAKSVSIASGSVYTISYHAPKGHFSINEGYFKKSTLTSGHLTAMGGLGQKNGVFQYNKSSSVYPSDNGGGDNYWVDVLFSSSLLNSQPAPAAPTDVAVNAPDSTQVVINWQPSVSTNQVTDYVVYRNGTKIADTNTSTTYTDTTVKASTTYNYQIQAVDNAGTKSVLSTAVDVTVPVAPTTGSGSGSGGTGTGTGSGGTTTGGTSNTTCPLPKYPTPSCTGVPAGTTFTKTVGSYSAVTAGEVIDGWHITGDLDVRAQNVVIRNTQVDGTINNDGIANSSFTVSDATVGTTTCAPGGLPSIDAHDFTANRVLLRGHQDGVDMSGANNVTVIDSYMQPCFLPVPGTDGYHSDGVQDQCDTTCSNLTLTHNTIDARAYYNGQPTGNSALNLGSPADGSPPGMHLRNVTLANNLFMGGGYSTSIWWDAGNNWTVTGNAWAFGSWQYGSTTANGTCKNQTWSGNSVVTIDGNYNVTGTVAAQACEE